MKGKAAIVRYADDAVIICELKEDAERIYKVLGARFEKFGLKIHPEKTRLLDFKKPREGKGKGNDSFSFLGFTHYWTLSRKGYQVVGKKTESKRLQRAITAINTWCKENRHQPILEQWKKLKAKIIGHYAYYGISMNFRSIEKFYIQVRILWRKWLNRRGWKGKQNWTSYAKLLERLILPKPRITHSYC